MDLLILLLPVLLIYMCIVIVHIQQSRSNRTMPFGVALPKKAIEHPKIRQAQAAYHRSFILLSTAGLLAAAPLLWLSDYFSLAFIYTVFWVIAFLYIVKIPFTKAHHTMAHLKREKEWFVGARRDVSIEEKITRLTRATAISPYWFAAPALIGVVPIIVSLQNANELLKLAGLASLAMTVIIFVIYNSFSRMKTKQYSDNHSVNIAINQASRRYWSIMWLCLALFESGCSLVVYTILTDGNSSSFTIWLVSIMLVSLIPLGSMLYVHDRIGWLTERYGQTDGRSLATDDDEYWINGSIYSNPNDPSLMVPKRLGIGMTINRATRAGKWIWYGSIGFAAALILAMSLFAIQSDRTAPELTIDEDGTVTIHYPQYGSSFKLENIEDITLEENLPSGFRTNGIATAEYARGSFDLAKLGAAKLYVFKKCIALRYDEAGWDYISFLMKMNQRKRSKYMLN